MKTGSEFRQTGNRSGGSRSGTSELERLLHLFVSFQILFGSRRGGMATLVLFGILVGGWFLWSWLGSPLHSLEAADRKWDTGVTEQRIEAISEYKSLLRARDPLETERRRLGDRNDRARLYRRIIEHHVKFDIELRDAREWSLAAWQENIRDLSFGDPDVDRFYRGFVGEIRARGLKVPADLDRLERAAPPPALPDGSGS